MHPEIPCVCTYVILYGIYTQLQELLIEAKSHDFVKTKKKFTLYLLDDVIRDIVKGDVWCCSQPNLLILGPNKTGTALGACGSIASGSACPSILCVEGKWFC